MAVSRRFRGWSPLWVINMPDAVIKIERYCYVNRNDATFCGYYRTELAPKLVDAARQAPRRSHVSLAQLRLSSRPSEQREREPGAMVEACHQTKHRVGDCWRQRDRRPLAAAVSCHSPRPPPVAALLAGGA